MGRSSGSKMSGVGGYLAIVKKRIGLLISILALFSIIAVFNHFYSVKTYRAITVFQIVQKPDAGATAFAGQLRFLRSHVMADRVAARLAMPGGKRLLGMVRVRAVRGEKNRVNLSVEGLNAEKTADIANTWVREFDALSRNQAYDLRTTVSGIKVIDKAQVPRTPTSRQAEKIAQIFIVGLVLAVVICFFLEYLDHTLRTPNGVETYAGITFLQEVPPALKGTGKDRGIDRLVRLDPETLMAEAFRNLKVAVIFASPGEMPLRTLMVTSSVLAEGKSFIASNLAITFARTGEPTILVDANMSRGVLGEAYGVSNGKGLSSFLSGGCGLDEVIFETDTPDLFILPSGPRVSDAGELLTPDKVDSLFQPLRSRFKRIIVDAPAILASDGAPSWAENCDGLLYVIGSGFTPLKEVLKAKDRIGENAAVLGAVLNNVALENDFFYYYRYFQFYLKNQVRKLTQKKA